MWLLGLTASTADFLACKLAIDSRLCWARGANADVPGLESDTFIANTMANNVVIDLLGCLDRSEGDDGADRTSNCWWSAANSEHSRTFESSWLLLSMLLHRPFILLACVVVQQSINQSDAVVGQQKSRRQRDVRTSCQKEKEEVVATLCYAFFTTGSYDFFRKDRKSQFQVEKREQFNHCDWYDNVITIKSAPRQSITYLGKFSPVVRQAKASRITASNLSADLNLLAALLLCIKRTLVSYMLCLYEVGRRCWLPST